MPRSRGMLLVWWCLAWLSAFALAGAYSLPWYAGGLLWLALSPALVAGKTTRPGARGRRPFPPPGACAAALVAVLLALAGGLRAQAYLSRAPPDLLRFVGSEVTLVGTVDRDVRQGLVTRRLPVTVEAVEAGGTRAGTGGRVLIHLGQYSRLGPGTRVRLRGRLEAAPVLEDFDYAGYLLQRGIVGVMYRPEVEVLAGPSPWRPGTLFASAREGIVRSLARSLPEPEAALAAGILIGRDDTLSQEVKEDFRRSGLAHIIAVSGANLVVITALVFAAAGPLLGRRRALLPALAAILAYVLLAGAAWSIVRAALMALLYLGGEYVRRPRSGLPALAVAAFAITAVRPDAAFDVGFQLSVAATAGLMAFGPWLRFVFLATLGRRGRALVPLLLVEVAALTLSATLATLPISWATFGRVSLVGPLANILVEPLFAIALAAAGATALLAAINGWLGWLAGIGAYYPLHEIVLTARTLAAAPFASPAPGPVGARSAVLAGALFILAGWPCYRSLPPDPPRGRAPWSPRVRLALAAGGLLAAAAIPVAVTILPLAGPGDTRIIALDVGQGDAILVVTPHGHQVLVDGGPSGLRLRQELGAVLPHWDRTLDAVVLTHPQEDHLAGLVGLLDLYRVDHLLDTGVAGSSGTYRRFLELAGGRRTAVGRGSRFSVDGVTFEVLWPEMGSIPADVNDSSLVLKVSWEGRSTLLTGDAEGPALERLAALGDLRAEILKVPHHGSATTPAWFFSRVGSRVALISVGAENRFGHPSPRTLEALTGATVLRTDRDGRITVRLGRDGIRISRERGVSLLVEPGPGYGGRQEEASDDAEGRRQGCGPAPAGEADHQGARLRRGELPGRVREDARALCGHRGGPPAGLAAPDGQRVGDGRVQHAASLDPHAHPA